MLLWKPLPHNEIESKLKYFSHFCNGSDRYISYVRSNLDLVNIVWPEKSALISNIIPQKKKIISILFYFTDPIIKENIRLPPFPSCFVGVGSGWQESKELSQFAECIILTQMIIWSLNLLTLYHLIFHFSMWKCTEVEMHRMMV